MKEATVKDETRQREIRWAILRFMLGMLQIIGATMSLVFLLQTGASWLTLAATGITLVVTGVSRTIFGRKRERL